MWRNSSQIKEKLTKSWRILREFWTEVTQAKERKKKGNENLISYLGVSGILSLEGRVGDR